MNSLCVWATLATILLFTSTVEAQIGGVEFWKENFTMTCPQVGTWYKKQEIISSVETKEYELKYDGKTKGLYHCTYNDETTKKYYFYVKGKACSNCFELDGHLFAMAIILDIVGTAIVIVMIYKCTKNKSSARPTGHTPKARSGGRAPPVPNPDYEQLNLSTRAQDPYSVVNRMG